MTESYYCQRCGRNHKSGSRIGQAHRDLTLEPVGESSVREDGVGVVSVVAPPQEESKVEWVTGPATADTPGAYPEPMDPAVAALMDQIGAHFEPLFDAYEERIRVQERDIVRLQGTVEQLIQAPPAQPPVSNSLGFIKDLGINPGDIGKVIKQFVGQGDGDNRRDLIAQKFIEREEGMLNARIDQFLDAMYGDKIITVSEKDE